MEGRADPGSRPGPPGLQSPFALPAGATELVLVRHGSTGRPAEMPADALGRSDPALDENGVRQAAAVAVALAHEAPSALFVTPMRRTAQSAAPLAARLGREPVVIDDLHEVHLGTLELTFGERVARGEPLFAEVVRRERWDIAPGAESMEAFAVRVRAGLERAAELTGPDARGVAFVHGGVIAQACHETTGSRPLAFLFVENGSLTRLVRRAGGQWFLRAFNDTAHLSPRCETIGGVPRNV